MRRAFPCALVLVCASVVQARTITTTCELADTGESCSVFANEEAEIVYSISPQEITGRLSIFGGVIPDIDPYRADLAVITYSYRDSSQICFVVPGGSGSGTMSGMATFYGASHPDSADTMSMSLETNFPLHGDLVAQPFTVPFTFGKPLTFFINVDYVASARNFFVNSFNLGFSLRAPEGAYFTPVPEPGTMALLPAGFAFLYRVRKRRMAMPSAPSVPQRSLP